MSNKIISYTSKIPMFFTILLFNLYSLTQGEIIYKVIGKKLIIGDVIAAKMVSF